MVNTCVVTPGENQESSLNSDVTTRKRKRAWLGLLRNSEPSLASNHRKKYKLRIKLLSFSRTKLGDRNNLPDEGVLLFKFVTEKIDSQKTTQFAVMPVNSNGLGKSRHSIVLLPVPHFVKMPVIFLEIEMKFNSENKDYKFVWRVNLNVNESAVDSSFDTLSDLNVTLFAVPENRLELASEPEYNNKVVALVNEKLPKNPNALAQLKLSFSWKRNKLDVDKSMEKLYERKFWMKDTSSKLPVTYLFKLSCFDDVTVQKQSFDCVWCNWNALCADNLALHYQTFHSNFHIECFKLSTGFRVIIQRKIKPEVSLPPPKSEELMSRASEKEFFFMRKRWRSNVPDKRKGFPYFPGIENFTDCDTEVDIDDPATLRSMNENGRNKMTYYCGRTCSDVLNRIQQEEDSDEEDKHVAWQYEFANRQISEFVDVSDSEKEFIALWNEHRLNYIHVNGDVEMCRLMSSFIYAHHSNLIAKNLMCNFMLHLINVFHSGCVSLWQFQQLMCLAQTLKVCPSVFKPVMPKNFV